MPVATRRSARLPHRWMKRVRNAVVVYLVVGFLTSLVGFNLLGAVFFSGPLFGRVVDSNGHGIRGAFVAYEWAGQSFHGSTGCQTAAIVRSGVGGFYVVPWQGWRLFHAMGWGSRLWGRPSGLPDTSRRRTGTATPFSCRCRSKGSTWTRLPASSTSGIASGGPTEVAAWS